jgi:hypothetical protein
VHYNEYNELRLDERDHRQCIYHKHAVDIARKNKSRRLMDDIYSNPFSAVPDKFNAKFS